MEKLHPNMQPVYVIDFSSGEMVPGAACVGSQRCYAECGPGALIYLEVFRATGVSKFEICIDPRATARMADSLSRVAASIGPTTGGASKEGDE